MKTKIEYPLLEVAERARKMNASRMGIASISKELGITEEETRQVITDYKNKFAKCSECGAIFRAAEGVIRIKTGRHQCPLCINPPLQFHVTPYRRTVSVFE